MPTLRLISPSIASACVMPTLKTTRRNASSFSGGDRLSRVTASAVSVP
jgi:hypothetical protein